MSEIRDTLGKIDLFAGLPVSLLDRLAGAAHRVSVRKGEFVLRQGEEAHLFFVVLAGRLRLVQHTADGKDVTMSVFVPGDAIGLIVAIMDELYPGSAEALEDSDTLALPGDLMWQAMNDNAPLAVRVLKMVAGRLKEAHSRIRELSAERTEQRVARSLLRLVQKVGAPESDDAVRLDMRLGRQDLAQMNGTTLETVSRILAVWERDGIVRAGREQITILNPHALVVIAEDLPH